MSAASDAAYVRISLNYVLPNAVKVSLDAAIQQANATAIVMGLFAAALASFAQIVSGASIDTTTVSFGAMLVFLYAALMFSLAGAFLSLIVIKMCSDLPLAAQQQILAERDPTSGKKLKNVLDGIGVEPSPYTVSGHFRLLEYFGMSSSYKLVDRLSDLVLIAACVCTFATLTFWVFLSEPIITAGVTMVSFGAVAIIVILAYLLAGKGQGWS